MTYLKDDEEIHEKFEEDDAILQAESGGQEALIENFQCYKAGYIRGKREAESKIAKQQRLNENKKWGDDTDEKIEKNNEIKDVKKIESKFIKGLKEKEDNWVYRRIVNGDIKINLNTLQYDQKTDICYAELVTVPGNKLFGYVDMRIGKKRPIITSYCVSKDFFNDDLK